MVVLGLIVVVVIVGVGFAYGASRRRAAPDAIRREAAQVVPAEGLGRWVAAGLITEDQAQAITEYEHAQQVRPVARPKPRVSPVVEALAYLGGILLVVGPAMLIGQSWHRLGIGGRLGILGAAAALTGAVGAAVGERDAVTWRLRGFLWALSVAAIAGVAGLFAFEVLDVSGEPVALAAAGVGCLASFGYWWMQDRPLQHVLTFVGLTVSVAVSIAWAGAHQLAIGVALWLLGLAWSGLAWRRRVPPAVVGFLLGMVLTLVASGIVGGQVEWLAPILGLATATGWVVVGVSRSEGLALAPGIVGVFVFLPWTLGFFFGDTFGAPAVAMLSGALLLGVVLVLVRRGRGRDGPVPRARRGHFGTLAHR